MFESRALYEQLIAKDPGDVDAWYGLGDAWFHDTMPAPARFTAVAARLQARAGPRSGLRARVRARELHPRPAPPGRGRTWVLLANDSIAGQGETERRSTIDTDAAGRRWSARAPRRSAWRSDWATLQPATPRAHEALLDGAARRRRTSRRRHEVARFRGRVPRYPELPFDDARIRFASGDVRTRHGASSASSMDSLTPEDLRAISGATDAVERMTIAANVLRLSGQRGHAATLIDLDHPRPPGIAPPATTTSRRRSAT